MTTKSELNRAYARALFDLATAADTVDAAGVGIAAIAEAIGKSPELADALGDVSLPAAKKSGILAELFAGVAPEAIGVALVAIERDGVKSLPGLSAAFDEIAQAERNVVVAEVTTASPLAADVRTKVQEKLSASIGKPVVLRERVDASVLGGIRIRVAGRVLDGTLSKQLTSIRSALSDSPAGGEA